MSPVDRAALNKQWTGLGLGIMPLDRSAIVMPDGGQITDNVPFIRFPKHLGLESLPTWNRQTLPRSVKCIAMGSCR